MSLVCYQLFLFGLLALWLFRTTGYKASNKAVKHRALNRLGEKECAGLEVMKYEIKYIEEKSDVASLEANIGKVFLSKTGKTLEYKSRKLQSLKGGGYKANYFDVETGERYWVSNCRKDGNDALYKTTVLVDEEIREEYWSNIRGLPELKKQSSFVSTGKHQAGGKEPKSKRENI